LPLRRALLLTFGLLLCTLLTTSALAQGGFGHPAGDPGLELFGGYSSYHPGGTLENKAIPNFSTGAAAQLIYPTTPFAAILADFSYHRGSGNTGYDFDFGVRLHRRIWKIIPFAEVMIGGQHLSITGYTTQTSPTYSFGAGVEYRVSERLTIRPVEVIGLNTYFNPNANQANGYNYLNGYRVQSGLVYNFLLPALPPPVATCAASPEAVDSGTPVKLAVVTKGFPPKHHVSYQYATTGGAATADQDGATVDTASVKAGSYTVAATVHDNGRGKRRMTATCEAAFRVNEQHPPTLSLSADPGTVHPGEASTITANGSSPDGRTLTYECSASGGKLAGSGSTYTLDTAGVEPGSIAIACSVTDDRKLSAKANAVVQISEKESPQELAKVTASNFGSIGFHHDSKRPARVDNEAKGELDRFADAMAAAPDAKAIVVGYAAPADDTDAAKRTTVAAQRAVNSKDYLTRDKGVDAARIEVRTGTAEAQKVELWLVPSGATFNAEGSTAVDEAKVKAIPRKPLATQTKPAAKAKSNSKTKSGSKAKVHAKPSEEKDAAPAEAKPADAKPAAKTESRKGTASTAEKKS